MSWPGVKQYVGVSELHILDLKQRTGFHQACFSQVVHKSAGLETSPFCPCLCIADYPNAYPKYISGDLLKA